MPRVTRGQASHLDLERQLRSNMTGPEIRLWVKTTSTTTSGTQVSSATWHGPYIVDFYCSEQSLVIEVDGNSHADADQIPKDQLRDRYFQPLGLRVIRYINNDILKNLDGVLKD